MLYTNKEGGATTSGIKSIRNDMVKKNTKKKKKTFIVKTHYKTTITLKSPYSTPPGNKLLNEKPKMLLSFSC